MSTSSNRKPPQLSLDALARIDKVCTRFEDARQKGEELDIEQLVTGFEGPEYQQLLVELLLIDFAVRSGEDLDRIESDYRVRLPNDVAGIQLAAKLHREQYERRNSSNNVDRMTSPVARSAIEDVLPDSNGDQPKHVRYVGEYEVLNEIARGGMGVVFKARQKTLKRIVALKMILSGRLANQPEIERFKREAQAASRLQHPNIVAIHEIGAHQGRHYFTMDYIDGSSLADVLREEILAPLRAANLVRTVAEAVNYAHDEGILHRDLKPANVLLSKNGTPHVTDFGLAKVFDERDEDSWQRLTVTGQVVGTPSYMSPEQAAGKGNLVGTASDIWSLGAILYACLTGRPPFLAETQVETIMQVLHKEPVPPSELSPGVPKDLENICLKCLNKEPHRRYGTAQELADDLNRFVDGRPVLARSVGRTVKLIRWAKRNLLVASLIALSALLLISGTGISVYFAVQAYQRAEAEVEMRNYAQEQKTIAENAFIEVKETLDRVESTKDHAIRSLYTLRINLGRDLWRKGDIWAADLDYTNRIFGAEVDWIEPAPQTELAVLNKMITENTKDPYLRHQRAMWYARRFEWKQAITDLKQSYDLQDGAAKQDCYLYLCVFGLMADDPDTYQEFLDLQMKQLGNYLNSNQILKGANVALIASLHPDSVVDYQVFLPFTERYGRTNPTEFQRIQSSVLTHLRIGNHEVVLKKLEKLNTENLLNEQGILSHSIRAIASHHLGMDEQAVKSLRSADKVFEETFSMDSVKSEEVRSRNIHELIHAYIIFKQAQELIDSH